MCQIRPIVFSLVIKPALIFLCFLAFTDSIAQNMDSLQMAAKKAKDPLDKALLFVQLSNFCEIKEIESYASKAIDLAQPLVTSKNEKERKRACNILADANNNIGYGMQQMGNPSEALNRYYKAISYYELTGDSLQTFETYNNLAAIYLDQGDSVKCLQIYNDLLSKYSKKKDHKLLYQVYNNLGYYYNEAGDSRKALSYYLNSKEHANFLPNESNKVLIDNNIGSAYLHLKMYDSALVFVLPSFDFYTKQNDRESLAWANNLLGRIYLEKADFDRAEKYLIESMNIAKEMKLNKQLMQSLDNLVFVSRNKSKYKEALEYLTEKVKLEKMIVNNENLKKLYQKEAKLEIEKQEAIANERMKQDRIRKQFLIACLILALLIAVIAIRSFIIKRRSNAILQEQNTIISEKKAEVEHQKHIIEEKQKEIVDSINYAKRIQYTLLAHDEFLKLHLPKHFVLFKPKDIVSGDFYWATSVNEGNNSSFYLAVCDSTGHGVPGAFMSLLNIGFLSEAINEKEISEPNKVFDHVRSRLINSLSKDGQKDGFDGILARIRKSKTDDSFQFTYAAAHNAPILIRNGELLELAADRMPVGMGERKDSFQLFEYELKKGDQLFLYTDGFADQFGGPKGKKFKYKQLNDLLLANAELPTEDQKQNLLSIFEKWRGNLEQVDDVCVIGIRV